MFTRGSRYRNLPESATVDAAGERLRGKDLRLIPETAGQFLHTVSEGDRLDLLAFKYYGDATKWWQIADANPQASLPSDLVDQRPLTQERFVLRHPGFQTRFRNLVIALSALGAVQTPFVSSFEADYPADQLAGIRPVEPGFVEASVVVTYAPSAATHQTIVNQIQTPGIDFHFLRAFAWSIGPKTIEAFSFNDPRAWADWNAVEKSLSTATGVLEVNSTVTKGALEVLYNSVVRQRESIISIITSNGFDLQPESVAFSRVGSKIVIPPNRIV